MIKHVKNYCKNNRQLSFANCKFQSGFTMLELLLYMGIFSILLIVLMQLFGSILATHIESQATSSVDQDGNFILARLAYDIHNSSSISGSNCTWSVGSATPCQLILSNNWYTASLGNLSLTENGYTDVVNSVNTTIKSITFTTLSNTAVGSKPSVQIVTILQSKTQRQGGRLQEQTFQTTVATR